MPGTERYRHINALLSGNYCGIVLLWLCLGFFLRDPCLSKLRPACTNTLHLPYGDGVTIHMCSRPSQTQADRQTDRQTQNSNHRTMLRAPVRLKRLILKLQASQQPLGLLSFILRHQLTDQVNEQYNPQPAGSYSLHECSIKDLKPINAEHVRSITRTAVSTTVYYHPFSCN